MKTAYKGLKWKGMLFIYFLFHLNIYSINGSLESYISLFISLLNNYLQMF